MTEKKGYEFYMVPKFFNKQNSNNKRQVVLFLNRETKNLEVALPAYKNSKGSAFLVNEKNYNESEFKLSFEIIDEENINKYEKDRIFKMVVDNDLVVVSGTVLNNNCLNIQQYFLVNMTKECSLGLN